MTAPPGPHAPPSAWGRRRERIAADIEQAAMDLMRERGFHGVTARDVADAVGISERTFFRYFPTKDALLLAEPVRAVHGLRDHLDSRPRREPLLQALGRAVTDLEAARQQHEQGEETFRAWGSLLLGAPDVAARINGQVQALMAEVLTDAARARSSTPLQPGQARALGASLAALFAQVTADWLADPAGPPVGHRLSEALAALATLTRPGVRK